MDECKYCLEGGFSLIQSPCMCKNKVHVLCLGKWFWVSSTTHCPECKYDLIKDNAIIKYYYFLTMACLSFLEFCGTITTTIFEEPN